MKTILFFLSLTLLLSSTVFAQDYSLPYPPPEFFVELGKTTIPPGKVGCCQKLRKMLADSVMISPYLAVKLFREGKILIGDARTKNQVSKSHVYGALLVPHDTIDFMKIKPIRTPIALY